MKLRIQVLIRRQAAQLVGHFDHGFQSHQPFINIDDMRFEAFDIAVQAFDFIGQLECIE